MPVAPRRNSSYIQESFIKYNYNKTPPNNPVRMRNVVLQLQKRKNFSSFFENKVKLGIRFFITLDKYTSLQNRRYININVHGKTNHWSLGLVELSGLINSSRIAEIIFIRLKEFGVDLNKHIVGCTTNGIAVIIKFGREIDLFHQCVVNTIHLIMCDVLLHLKKSVIVIV